MADGTFRGEFRHKPSLSPDERPAPWRDGNGEITVTPAGIRLAGSMAGWTGPTRFAAAIIAVIVGVGIQGRAAGSVPPYLESALPWLVALVAYFAFVFAGRHRRTPESRDVVWRDITSVQVAADETVAIKIGRVAGFAVHFAPTDGARALADAIAVHRDRVV